MQQKESNEAFLVNIVIYGKNELRRGPRTKEEFFKKNSVMSVFRGLSNFMQG